MIYLLDDKMNRQIDYGWTQDRFKTKSGLIYPIYLYKAIEDKATREEIFTTGNTILLHESFFDNAQNKQKEEGIEIRNRLTAFAQKEADFRVVYFSGSKSSRMLNKNIGHIPVAVLYQNLDIFISKVNEGDINLRYLLFGENYKIEEKLLNKLLDANNKIEASIDGNLSTKKNFIARAAQYQIEKPFFNAVYETFFLDEKENNEITDKYLSEKIEQWFTKNEFDNIFIPLCFGSVLSDFNGLRFATHIRSTDTPNRLKNIFIYAFVGYEYFINNEYFDILRTKNVCLIDYKKSEFLQAAELKTIPLLLEELRKEMRKLKLEPPKNYDDNHGVVNEWAIYQWAKSLRAEENNELTKIYRSVQTNLYFKYLSTINPVTGRKILSNDAFMIAKEGEQRILLIDDEAEKGWYEIFAYLLGDLNDIYVDYIGEDFAIVTRYEIIEQSLQRIRDEDIDVVILDFRLNSKDLSERSAKEITSIKLLHEIKKFNSGIQVIGFSATDKVWNLQALQAEGIDGFIFKGFENNISDAILNLVKMVNRALERALWLKPMRKKTDDCIGYLMQKRKGKTLDKDLVGAIITYLELGFDSLISEKKKYPYDTAFIYYFLILETFSKEFIVEDKPIKEGGKFRFMFRINNSYLHEFDRESGTKSDAILKCKDRRIPYVQKFLNLIHFANIENVNPVHLVDLRNAFNHPDLVTAHEIVQIQKNDIIDLFNICEKLISKL